MAHSNQRNFLEHSEEPYNKYRYLCLIPNLQLTSAGRTGTANGPQMAFGPHFAQVWVRGPQPTNNTEGHSSIIQALKEDAERSYREIELIHGPSPYCSLLIAIKLQTSTTSLQSHLNLVCRLLLDTKNKYSCI